MKTLLTAAFIFVSSFLIAQKKYDCIVLTKGNDNMFQHRFVGYLKFVGDSTIHFISKEEDTLFNWNSLQAVKFRLHNGFTRIALPIASGIGVLGASIVITSNTGIGRAFAVAFFPVVAILFSFNSLYVITPAYFVFRNKEFKINSYDDFKKLKQVSAKYILK